MPAIYLDDCALAALAHALERVALEAQIARDIRLAGHSTWGGCAAPAARSAGAPSPLQSSVLPSISMHDYVRRIHRHFRCSGVCLYFALAYILRLARLDSPQVQVSEMSIHRLFLCGAVVAAKVLDDRYYSNKYCACFVGCCNRCCARADPVTRRRGDAGDRRGARGRSPGPASQRGERGKGGTGGRAVCRDPLSRPLAATRPLARAVAPRVPANGCWGARSLRIDERFRGLLP